MVHRKRLLLTNTEQLTDPTAREHMLRLIHYHAVHDPRSTDLLHTPHTPLISVHRLQETTRAPQKNTHHNHP